LDVARLRAGEGAVMSQQPSAMSGTQPQTWAIVVWGLFIASYFTALMTGIVAVIIAYVKRDDLAGTPFESHMTSAIRTFWISLIVGIIGIVLAFVGIGFIILGLLALWQLFRVIRGLVRALDGAPIADPTGWL
jgi:uncharacterized membrane protein